MAGHGGNMHEVVKLCGMAGIQVAEKAAQALQTLRTGTGAPTTGTTPEARTKEELKAAKKALRQLHLSAGHLLK